MKQKRIVALGDSLTYGYMVEEESKWINILNSRLKDVSIINKGINGNLTRDMKEKTERDVIGLEPIFCLIWGMANDVFYGEDIKNTKENLEYIGQMCINHHIKPLYILTTYVDYNFYTTDMEKAKIRAMNEKILSVKDFYDKENYDYLDLYQPFKDETLLNGKNLYNDAVHFNDQGSKLVATLMYDFIKERL